VRSHAARALSLDPKQPEARLLMALHLSPREREARIPQMTLDTRDDVRGWLALLHWTGKFDDTLKVIGRLRGLVHSVVPLPTLANQDEIMRTCKVRAQP
jgi:hypothetical protein